MARSFSICARSQLCPDGASLPSEREMGVSGMPLSGLNGSMWSIPYEFQCYILVIFLSATSL